MIEQSIRLMINGAAVVVGVRPYDSLNFILREKLGLTGTKKGCDTGGCGSCTVLIGGQSRYSCMTYAMSVQGSEIVTIEGLAKDDTLDPLQEAFVQAGALQCGFCTPGLIMAAKALLLDNPAPAEREVKEAIIGNLCRCTGYVKVLDAVLSAAKPSRERQSKTPPPARRSHGRRRRLLSTGAEGIRPARDRSSGPDS